MRLIDADALKDHIKIFNIGCGCFDDYQKSFLNAIDEQPTVEPDPCDVCEELEEGDTLYSHSEWDGGIRDYIRDIKFCPKCGRRL